MLQHGDVPGGLPSSGAQERRCPRSPAPGSTLPAPSRATLLSLLEKAPTGFSALLSGAQRVLSILLNTAQEVRASLCDEPVLPRE